MPLSTATAVRSPGRALAPVEAATSPADIVDERAASPAIDASPLLRGRQRLGCKDLLRGAVESAPKPPRSTSWTPSRALVLTTAPLHVMWPRADRGGGDHLSRDGAVVSRASSTALGRDFRRNVPMPCAYVTPRVVTTSAACAGRIRVERGDALARARHARGRADRALPHPGPGRHRRRA